jgi:hypothetical protein
MNKLIFILVILSFSLNVYSNDCRIKKDTLYYIEIDIRSNDAHPIIMAGISKNPNFKNYSQKKSFAYLSSFYENNYYVPDLYRGYNRIIKECLGDEKGNEYLLDHQDDGLKIMPQLVGNSIGYKIILDNGENVFIRITQISGSFWIVNKDSKALVGNSNEISIMEIDEIQDVYAPFKIYWYNKLKRKFVKDLFK